MKKTRSKLRSTQGKNVVRVAEKKNPCKSAPHPPPRFSPGEGLLKFIYLNLLLNLFFPWEGLSKFIFSWRRASEIFFLDFLRPHPEIING